MTDGVLQGLLPNSLVAQQRPVIAPFDHSQALVLVASGKSSGLGNAPDEAPATANGVRQQSLHGR